MPPKKRRGAPEPDTHIGFLDEVDGTRPATKRRRAADDPLDLDGIW